MYTALINKSTGRIVFSQSGKADHASMVKNAVMAGITDYEIVELDDAAHAEKIKPQAGSGIQVVKANLQDVIDAQPADIKAKIAAAVEARSGVRPLKEK